MKYLSAIKEFLETKFSFEYKLRKLINLKFISLLNTFILVHYINLAIVREDQKEKGILKNLSPPGSLDVI